MASEEVVTLPFDATLRPRIIGKQGKNVRSLSEHFKVRLAFNAAGDSVDIVGENRVAAAKAIESLLRGEQLQTALKASSTPNIKTPLETTPTQCQIVHTPTYFFLKFRLYVLPVSLLACNPLNCVSEHIFTLSPFHFQMDRNYHVR